MTKYRYTVVSEGVVEANTPAEAESLALWEVDNGVEQAQAVEVEELRREENEG